MKKIKVQKKLKKKIKILAKEEEVSASDYIALIVEVAYFKHNVRNNIIGKGDLK